MFSSKSRWLLIDDQGIVQVETEPFLTCVSSIVQECLNLKLPQPIAPPLLWQTPSVARSTLDLSPFSPLSPAAFILHPLNSLAISFMHTPRINNGCRKFRPPERRLCRLCISMFLVDGYVACLLGFRVGELSPQQVDIDSQRDDHECESADSGAESCFCACREAGLRWEWWR